MSRHPHHRIETNRKAGAKKARLRSGIALAASAAVAVTALGVTAAGAFAAQPTYVVSRQIAADTFDRTQATGWGSAQVGGAYSASPAAAFSVSSAAGTAA